MSAVDWLRRSSGLVVPAMGFANLAGQMQPCPSGNCCGGPTVPCPACDSGTIPESLSVTISGVTNNGCTGCGGFNGTFSIPSSAVPCGHYLLLGLFACGGEFRNADIIMGLNGTGITCQIGYGSGLPFNYLHTAFFQATGTDCLNYSNRAASFVSESNTFPGFQDQCALSGATITISS